MSDRTRFKPGVGLNLPTLCLSGVFFFCTDSAYQEVLPDLESITSVIPNCVWLDPNNIHDLENSHHPLTKDIFKLGR